MRGVPLAGRDTARLLTDLDRELDDAGLRGWFLVRDLRTGEEVGLRADEPVPVASLVKVPLALAVLDRVRRGRLGRTDGATRLRLEPGASPLHGPAGVTKFRHPVDVALDDVVYLAVALSDNAAADALFDLVPPEQVTRWLQDAGIDGLTVRHAVADLSQTPAEALSDTPHLAQTLATTGGTPGRGHRVRQLDVARASSASASALVGLLAAVWDDAGPIDVDVARRVRAVMADNVMRQRLWPDLASDAATWASKTATVLNLRHEIGVWQHRDGAAVAVVALTESRVPATVQPQAEMTMARVARRLLDHLRARTA